MKKNVKEKSGTLEDGTKCKKAIIITQIMAIVNRI
tara:strand:+ start:11063 stop:11167 length:105 start_codon:yes stop_codon:yes gene_type:complete